MEKYQPLKGVLTEAEVCEFLGLKPELLGRLRREKRLPFIKLGGCRLYFEKDLMAFFEASRVVLNDAE